MGDYTTRQNGRSESGQLNSIESDGQHPVCKNGGKNGCQVHQPFRRDQGDADSVITGSRSDSLACTTRSEK